MRPLTQLPHCLHGILSNNIKLAPLPHTKPPEVIVTNAGQAVIAAELKPLFRPQQIKVNKQFFSKELIEASTNYQCQNALYPHWSSKSQNSGVYLYIFCSRNSTLVLFLHTPGPCTKCYYQLEDLVKCILPHTGSEQIEEWKRECRLRPSYFFLLLIEDVTLHLLAPDMWRFILCPPLLISHASSAHQHRRRKFASCKDLTPKTKKKKAGLCMPSLFFLTLPVR